jgi:hypothetical protein
MGTVATAIGLLERSATWRECRRADAGLSSYFGGNSRVPRGNCLAASDRELPAQVMSLSREGPRDIGAAWVRGFEP